MKNRCSQKFHKMQSKLAVIEIYSKTELLPDKLLPQKKTSPKKILSKRHYQNCSSKKRTLSKFLSQKTSKLLSQN